MFVQTDSSTLNAGIDDINTFVVSLHEYQNEFTFVETP